MNELRASLREYGHPDIILHVDARWSRLAEFLPNYFVEEAQNGVRFGRDQTVQVGCSLLKLAATPNGELSGFEPDFHAMPIRWIRGVNRTVGLLAVQRAVCGECQVEPAFPSILQPAFSTELMPTADRFTMLRSNAEGNHSGWSFHEPRDVGGGLLSLYEAATINAAIAPFLALPVGSVVKRDGDGLSVWIEGRHISSGSSDLLSRLAGKESFESVTSRLAAND